MRARRSAAGLSLALLIAGYGQIAAPEADRSASIRQVTRGVTLAERSAAAFDQIATVEAGRSKVDQIDPALLLKTGPDPERLVAGEAGSPVSSCVLTPEQQAIVTSLEAQGRLPAGDCEMAAWFTQPQDKSEGEERALLSGSLSAGASELLGRDAEADRQAELAAQQRDAAAAAATVSTTYFTPAVPVPAGN